MTGIEVQAAVTTVVEVELAADSFIVRKKFNGFRLMKHTHTHAHRNRKEK